MVAIRVINPAAVARYDNSWRNEEAALTLANLVSERYNDQSSRYSAEAFDITLE
jgi:hypothetical protein